MLEAAGAIILAVLGLGVLVVAYFVISPFFLIATTFVRDVREMSREDKETK